MRLLVVEDEAKTADFLAKGLKESGFAVDVALNGLDGRYFVEQQEYESYAIADLEIDVLRRRVSRGGQRISLTNKEFALLQLLASRQGEVLSRTLIASQVWNLNFDSDTNMVEVAVRRLRAKVDDPYMPKLIHTVRGVGYQLEAPDE